MFYFLEGGPGNQGFRGGRRQAVALNICFALEGQHVSCMLCHPDTLPIARIDAHLPVMPPACPCIYFASYGQPQ